MKKIFVLLNFIFIATTAFSQFSTLEIYSRNTVGGQSVPDANIFGELASKSKFAPTYFFLAEPGFAEALFGFNYYITDHVSVGLSTGFETSSTVYRFGASFWAETGAWTFLVLGEKGDGKDNYWYKADILQEMSERITFGFVAWRYHGIGPVLKYHFNVGEYSSKVWVIPARDIEFEEYRIMVGIDIDL